MNKILATTYIDRDNGLVKTEYPFASGFLYWSYNSALGRILTTFILSRKIVSQLYGWLARKKFSRYFISVFIKRTNMIQPDSKPLLNGFSSFNDFFVREPKNGECRIDKNSYSLIAPVDGKLLVYTGIDPNNTFFIKRNIFNLRQFLCNDNLASKFIGGTMIVFRLCLSDYHQFYFPDSGVPSKSKAINGKYYAGGSYGIRKLTPFYIENYRSTAVFDSDHFGRIVIAEVGAFTVGSIKQVFIPNHPVNKGDKKGHFELGGSTVVLLFARDRIQIDDDLFYNSLKGFETSVRFGEKIGAAKILRRTIEKSAAL